MKKEDLCMLLIVVVLVLIISRNTKVFEGFNPDDIPGMDSIPGMDDIISSQEDPVPPIPKAPVPPTPKAPVPPTPKAPVPPIPKAPVPPTPKMPPMPPTPKMPPMPPTPKMPPMPPTPKMPPQARPQVPPTPPTPQVPPTPPQARPTPPQPRPQEQVPQQGEPTPFGTPLMDKNGAFGQGFLNAYDGGVSMFASATGELDTGMPSALNKEHLTKGSLGTLSPQIMQNLEEKRTPGEVMVSDFKPFDPTSTSGALLDTQFGGLQTGPTPPARQQPPAQQPPVQPTPFAQPPPAQQPPSGGGKPVEVHMVYGEWCGHSKRAMPAFEELVKESGVTTGSGSPVKFVMTEDTSPGMEQFKSKVRGFPTYMVVKPDGSMEELNGHDRSKDSIINAVSVMTV